MKKILFYTANGVGLGHLRRSSLIAKEILTIDKKSKVFFLSMCKDAKFLEEFNIPYKKLIPVSDKIIQNYAENQKSKKLNEDSLRKMLDTFKPDKIVLDIHVFANFSFPDSCFLKKYENIEKILIYRMTNKRNFIKNFVKYNDKFSAFDKIIIPHSKKEISTVLNKNDYEKLVKNDIITFSGAIFRKLNRKILPKIKTKYNLNKNNLNVTIALGGGGELKKGNCETPAKIILNFLSDFSEIKEEYKNIKIILVTGPLFSYKKIINLIQEKYSKYIKVVEYEQYLMELMSTSDLVITPIGYNAGNEIIEAKTPAITIPLLRGDNNSVEQLERAKYFKKLGFIQIHESGSEEKLKDVFKKAILSLKKMKYSLENYKSFKAGNQKCAKIILK